MLCCALIALLAPLGYSLAWRRGAPGTADCCRPGRLWRFVVLGSVAAALLLVTLALTLAWALPQSRSVALRAAWPICTMFGLQRLDPAQGGAPRHLENGIR